MENEAIIIPEGQDPTVESEQHIEKETINQDDNESESKSQSTETPEEKASRLGWKGEENYKGHPDKFVDAEEFISKAETDLPSIKQANRNLERDLKKTQKGVDAIIAHQQREVKAAEEKAYEKAMNDLQSKHISAVEDGDVEAAQKAWEDREKLTKEATQVSEPDPANKASIDSWKLDNDWFEKDNRMTQDAIAFETSLANQGVNDLNERLERTTAYIKNQYADKFHKARKAPQMNDTRNNVKKSIKANSYENLNREYKNACDRAIATSGGKITKESFLKYCTPDAFKN